MNNICVCNSVYTHTEHRGKEEMVHPEHRGKEEMVHPECMRRRFCHWSCVSSVTWTGQVDALHLSEPTTLVVNEEFRRVQ
jgi:hypothetical protein